MTIIAGVFDSETKIDSVLRALYDRGVDSDRVTLMRNTGKQGDGQVERSDQATHDIPIGAAVNPGQANASHGTPTAALATGALTNLGIKPEEMDYYVTLADRGAVVVFMESEDADELDFARQVMDDSSPQRLDVL